MKCKSSGDFADDGVEPNPHGVGAREGGGRRDHEGLEGDYYLGPVGGGPIGPGGWGANKRRVKA